jgi:methylated-DNA-protein-cysteine methyltransferase-like protein
MKSSSARGSADRAGRAGPRFADAVYRIVRRIPAGRVATYGQIAAALGRPRAARVVGTAMRHCPADLPWHRVVNAAGRISRRARVASMLTQRIRLEQEGVRIRGGRVALGRHRWRERGPVSLGKEAGIAGGWRG